MLAVPLLHVAGPNVMAPSTVPDVTVSVVISTVPLPTFPALSATSTFTVYFIPCVSPLIVHVVLVPWLACW